MIRLRKRLAGEEGWALITALCLMLIMGGVGLATAATVDTQSKQSSVERTREMAFNLAETVLNAQIFALTQKWPGSPGRAYGQCQSDSAGQDCPSPQTFPGADAPGASWKTDVRDNSTSADCTASNSLNGYYDDSLFSTVYRYDCNRDGKVWVRAEATAAGHTRTLVGLVRVEEQREDMPHGVIIAGRLTISNNGRHGGKDGIINATDSAQSAPVIVRCTPTLGEQTPCLGHPLTGSDQSSAMASLNDLLNAQIVPNVTQSNPGLGNALTPDALARLKATAIANGTYYAAGSCPSDLTGAVVWVESCSASFTGTSQFNSAAQPGVLIWNQGTLTLGGTTHFYGLIYHTNVGDLSGGLVALEGNSEVTGAIVVDGQGSVIAGSSGLNVQLDDNAFNAVQSYGNAGIVQNTWREIRSTP